MYRVVGPFFQVKHSKFKGLKSHFDISYMAIIRIMYVIYIIIRTKKFHLPCSADRSPKGKEKKGRKNQMIGATIDTTLAGLFLFWPAES